MPPRPWDRAIAGLADRQHGVVARRQLLTMGLGRRAIGGRLARGNLLEVHYGVYAVGRRALTKKGLWMAAVIAAGPGAVLSHRSAGRLWGLPVQEGGSIDVTCPGGSRARRPGIVGHAGRLAVDEVARIDAIPATSAARTQFDLAGVLSMRQLERVVDEAEALRPAGPRIASATAGAISAAPWGCQPPDAVGNEKARRNHPQRFRGGVRHAHRLGRAAPAAPQRRSRGGRPILQRRLPVGGGKADRRARWARRSRHGQGV
jgi:hypothetical protein